MFAIPNLNVKMFILPGGLTIPNFHYYYTDTDNTLYTRHFVFFLYYGQLFILERLALKVSNLPPSTARLLGDSDLAAPSENKIWQPCLMEPLSVRPLAKDKILQNILRNEQFMYTMHLDAFVRWRQLSGPVIKNVTTTTQDKTRRTGVGSQTAITETS